MQGLERTVQSARVEVSYAYSKTGRFELSDIPAGTDGVLVVSVFYNPDLYKACAACKIPCVVVGNRLLGRQIPTVSYDNQGAMEQVMQKLHEAGHRRIGFIRTAQSCQNYADRFSGWLTACSQLGMEPGPVFEGSGTPEAIYEALLPWLPQQLADTTAFVTWNDYVALATLRALRSCGATPGKDVAVIGFDDMPFAALSDPPLATVQLNENDLSATGMNYLLDLIAHPDQPVTHRSLPLEPVWRESFCAAPNK